MSSVAELIEEKFGEYYELFMPGLQSILSKTPNETREQKELRSNTIKAMGFIFEGVKDRAADF